MKLFFKSAPLQLKQIDAAEAWKIAGSNYVKIVKMLLHSGLPGGPSIQSLQRGPHILSPLNDQLYDPVKKQHSFIPDIRQYLIDNGITDRARQDAFIDAGSSSVTPRILVDKEAADTHEKMARATRQSGFGRNNPGYEFGDSAEIASHDFGDIRHFEHPVTGAVIPLFHVRRAVVVNRKQGRSSSSNIFHDPELHSRVTEAFKLGDHPSYGYLGITHTHPALSSVTPSKKDLQSYDSMHPYGYSQIIRPGVNMKEFTRQVIARYGSPEEAIRQWQPYERLDEYGRRLPAFDGPEKHNMRLSYLNFLRNGDGRDRSGMPVRGDARVFLFRDPQRPLTEKPNNAGDPVDFRSTHDGHVIYLGEPGSRKITDWSVIPHSMFKDSYAKEIRLGAYTGSSSELDKM